MKGKTNMTKRITEQPQQQAVQDPGEVVISVMVDGPHGPYRSTYTVNAVRRFFIDAHNVMHKHRNAFGTIN